MITFISINMNKQRRVKKIRRLVGKISHSVSTWWKTSSSKNRTVVIAGIILLLTTPTAIYILRPANYALGQTESLLPDDRSSASRLKFDEKTKVFSFSNGKTSQSEEVAGTEGLVKIQLSSDAKKGVTVQDSGAEASFTMVPRFGLAEGKQDGGRVIYPLSSRNGWLVYTMQGTGAKEDIILEKKSGDKMSFEYELKLPSGGEARLEKDGSVGVYGNSLLSQNVSAASEKDAALLEKARSKATKDTLLFRIPKPYVVANDKKPSNVKSAFTLDKNMLTLSVSGLSGASYPLAIDPSIYVASAQDFMRGNNETNIDFDIANGLIKKAPTTGARFDSWLTTTTLPTATWGASAAAAGGFIYSIGGTTFNGQILNTQGSSSFVVPTGVTSLTVKMWGAGGGGGGGANGQIGGAGGGGGFTQATISVTPGETLTTYVGGGGGGGNYSASGSDAGGGGGGGGHTSIYRGVTPLIIAAGGGGGGGARSNNAGGAAGGAGGGTTGAAGANIATNNGGGGAGGTQSAGGAAGAARSGANAGTTGASLSGGDGGDARNGAGADGSGAAGGLASGGNGGLSNISTTRSGGGGGGSGYFGGGGGSATTSTNGAAGGGGGGGSSYIVSGATSQQNTAGTNATPGNNTDSARGNAGNGGAAGASQSIGGTGNNGLIMLSYGAGTTVNSTVSWAQFNANSGTIDSANPGSGTCSGWCTTSSYNLPAPRTNFSLVAYNGFLYALGGKDASGNPTNSIYVAKIGANGEPQLWHPTDSNKNNWVYWYSAGTLSSTRSDSAAVAYNNRIYLLGGRSSGGPVNTSEYADINPTGTLGSWTAGTTLPSATYGHSAQIYNDRLYIVGGASSVGGAPTGNVHFTRLSASGAMNTWVQTTSFPTGRISNGGNISVIWGAYLYVSGGCSAVNASGYCTTVQPDTKVASINADGTIDVWNDMAGVSSTRMGSGLVAWRNKIYTVGGCSAQNTSTGDCTGNMIDTINYGSINRDGDASTVEQSVASGTTPCSGAQPVNCNLPGGTNVGNMLNSSIVANGYLYVIGGCSNNACSATNGNIAYVAISSTGQMTKPATCPNGAFQGGMWCVDTVNAITGGLGASSPVVFNNQLYLVGGLDGSGNTDSLRRTTLNADGSISAWTNQTLTGLGVNSVSYLYAYARANPSSAGTNPGNLYIFGGCATSSSAGCTAYSQNVYKCNIQTSGAIAGCSTSGQLQIGTIPGDTQTGLGIMSGTVYANYVYLIGGVSPNLVDLKTLRYAKFDNNNNIVAVSGGSWVESSNQMAVGRRRAAAFGYNGYIYVVGGYEAASGVLADIEFIKVNVSDGSLGSASDGFTVSAVQINQRWGLSVPVSNSFAYVIGGCVNGASPGGCSARTDVIQTFQIYNNASGAPANFTTSANTYQINPSRLGASSVIHNGYIYVAGGCIGTTDCSQATTNVSYAPIDSNGSVGTWKKTTGVLPAARAWGKLQKAGGSLYYIGGQGDNQNNLTNIVYFATPSSSDGDIATWTQASNGLPQDRTKFGATVWNDRLYVVGGQGTGTGCTGSNVCSTIYVSPQLSAGGNITSAWSTSSTSLSTARSGNTAVAYANNLYTFGGFDGTNYLSDSSYSQINASNGNAGAWTYTTSLPGPLTQSDGFAANGYIYLVGGRSDATTCSNSVTVSPVSANTTIASGNTPTGIGEWYQTNQRLATARYGATASYLDGKIYALGGGCGSTLSYGSPVTQQSSLLSQPQVARYSIMMDTDSDVFPTSWLLNGVDNSIGAKWQLKYRSMAECPSASMTTWGQETYHGDVTLGQLGAYTPKTGSGANTNCGARYYYFNVAVDSSQAFGYPDDVSRGPTISDLTLQFTADPSRRLMHGRTFTGGLQQPVDTPKYAF